MKAGYATRAAREASGRRQRGFTLVEIAVVLGIIAVILGAVTVGTDLLRSARGQRAYSEFVTAWSAAFTRYSQQVGRVPGDNAPVPTNLVAGGGGPLCGVPLSNEFLSHSVELPPGNGPGVETEYVYQDADGAPKWLRVCFRSVPDWSNQGLSVGSYVPVTKHVMQISGLSVELAQQIDTMIDGRADARFGSFRWQGVYNVMNANPANWPALPASGEVIAFLLVGS